MPACLDRIDRDARGQRDDVSPPFADGTAFTALVDDLGRRCDRLGYDVIAGLNALGFVLGAALARRAGRGLIVVRKAGSLPVAALRETSSTTRAPRKRWSCAPTSCQLALAC